MGIVLSYYHKLVQAELNSIKKPEKAISFVKWQPDTVAWAYENNNFYFSDRFNQLNPEELRRFGLKTGVNLRILTPSGTIDYKTNLLEANFDDEYIEEPYCTAIKGLYDLDIINDDTMIRFADRTQRIARIILAQLIRKV